MRDRGVPSAARSSKAPSGTSAVRRGQLTKAMLASGVSINDLTRRSGFLRHQIQAAIGGQAEITEATFKVLMRAIKGTGNRERGFARTEG